MELSVTSNIKEFSKSLSKFERTQVPYAASIAINETLTDVRDYVTKKSWPDAVQVRNKRFAGVAFRREFAKKYKLQGSIYDRLDRAAFKYQATGGTRRAKGKHLAVPTSNIKRTASGRVRKAQQPTNLKNSFVAPMKSGRKGLFQRYGPKGKKRRLMYAMPEQVQIRQSFDFHSDARMIATRKFGPNFVKAFNRAVQTARL